MKIKFILTVFILSLFAITLQPDDSSAQRMRGGSRGGNNRSSMNRSGNTNRSFNNNRKINGDGDARPIKFKKIQQGFKGAGFFQGCGLAV